MATIYYADEKTKKIGGVALTLPEGLNVTVRTQMNDKTSAHLYVGNKMDTWGLIASLRFSTKEECFIFLEAFEEHDGREW